MRHLLICAFFVISWLKLERWYYYQHERDYTMFAVSFVAAVLLAIFPLLRPLILPAGWKRLWIASTILILCIPWGELLHGNFLASREDWSRQILHQSIFLYLCFIVLYQIPLFGEDFAAAFDRVIERLSKFSRAFYAIAAVAFFCFCTWISIAVYHRTPMTQDTASHLFQAKIFLKGQLFAPSPRFPEFFSRSADMLVMKDGRWFSMYLPGFALLLAPLLAIGAQWLLGPLLGAATLLICLHYADRWYGRRVAVLLAFLFCLSPFFFGMFSTLMVHSLEAFLAAAAFYLSRRLTEEYSFARAILLFFTLVLAVITRGFSLLPFLAPLFVYSALLEYKSRKSLKLFAVIASAVFIGGAALALFNLKTTENPFTLGYALKVPYGPVQSSTADNWTPLRGLENTSNNLLGLNNWLNGWLSGSFALLLLFLLASEEHDAWDVAAICCVGVLLLFYSFYIIQDLVFGPRFFFPAALLLMMFIARLPFLGFPQMPEARKVIICIYIASILTFVPLRLSSFLYKYNVPDSQAGRLNRQQAALNEKTLIFLDPETHQHFVNWNEPFLQGSIIYSRDLGAENKLLQDEFPNYRPIYFRRLMSFGHGDLKEGYLLTPESGKHDAPHLSLFALALAIESTAAHSDLDCFDVCYAELFHGQRADLLLQDLEQSTAHSTARGDYRDHFKNGLIHSAHLMLFPKQAYETRDSEWRSGIDFSSFSHELDAAIHEFSLSGPVGKVLLAQMQKVKGRIDQNEDGVTSSAEIEEFLLQKVHELEVQL